MNFALILTVLGIFMHMHISTDAFSHSLTFHLNSDKISTSRVGRRKWCKVTKFTSSTFTSSSTRLFVEDVDTVDTTDKTTDKTADKTRLFVEDVDTVDSTDKTTDKTADKTADKAADKTAEKTADKTTDKKLSLEEKMASWEATDEEKKAATLGGMIPGGKTGDSFDVGLWIAFPFIVGFSLLFALFPFIMENIDTSSVGPPPMV